MLSEERQARILPLPAPLLAMLLTAGSAPAVLPLDYRLQPRRRPDRIVPSCEAEEDEILVCGRRVASYRVSGGAAARPVDGRLFGIDLAPGVRLEGGGPRGSVGLGLKITF